jgi:hypothetical protein
MAEQPQTHLDMIQSADLPRWGSGSFWGQRFIGIVVGVCGDMLADGASIALVSQFSTMPDEQPLDALDILAQDCLRPHYTGELYSSVRQRVLGKWDFWTGSPKSGMIAEFAATGSAVTIKVPGDFVSPPAPTSYWSRFWVDFALGTHPVSIGGAAVGSAVVGTSRLGPTGIGSASGEIYWRQLNTVTKRYKPLQWVPWDFEFEYSSGKFIRLMGHKRFRDANYVYQDP